MCPMMGEPRLHNLSRRGCARHSFTFVGGYFLSELVGLYALLILVVVFYYAALLCLAVLELFLRVYYG